MSCPKKLRVPLRRASFLLLFVSTIKNAQSVSDGCAVSVTSFGAIGDGVTLNTASFVAAVNACSGGGRVVVPAGNESGSIFLTGSLELPFDGLELHVEKGATILGSTQERDYPLIPILPSYGSGRDVDSKLRYRPLIFASNVSKLSLTGGGVVDGQGKPWWLKHFAKELHWSRPRLVECMYCTDLLIEDLTFRDSPFWTLHPYASDGVIVQRVTVTAPGWAPNTDGVDPDSCSNVLIKDCVFRAGDDGVAIKSGLNEAGRAFGKPCENVRIENVTVEPDFDNGSTNGVSIGSEMSGGIRNVSVDGLVVQRCAVGVYIKSMEGRGGTVEDVTFRNIVADRVMEPIRFAMDYSYRRRRLDSVLGKIKDEDNGSDEDTTPCFRNLTVENLTATGAALAGTFAGLATSEITNIRLQDVSIHGAKEAFVCRYASGTAIRTTPETCF